MAERGLTIGMLASNAGVNVETVRFYQRKGLLREPPRPYGGIRRYRMGDAARVRFIKSAQRLGLNLAEVGELLRLEDGTGCDEARGLAERKLADVRARRHDLERLEAVLETLVTACATQTGEVSCPLIGALWAEAEGTDAPAAQPAAGTPPAHA